MSKRNGGDHELDVVELLRRNRDDDGLRAIRTAVQELAQRDPTACMQQLFDLACDTRRDLRTLIDAVQGLAEREGPAPAWGENLVDISGMTSFTTEVTLTPRSNPAYPHEFCVDLVRSMFFAAVAVSAKVFSAHDRSFVVPATVKKVECNAESLLYAPIDAERWRAPPGRGHPAGWLFSTPALAYTLRVSVETHSDIHATHELTTIFALTLSGYPMDILPPGMRPGSLPRGFDQLLTENEKLVRWG